MGLGVPKAMVEERGLQPSPSPPIALPLLIIRFFSYLYTAFLVVDPPTLREAEKRAGRNTLSIVFRAHDHI